MKSSFISIRNLPSCKNFARNKSKFVLIVIFASALLMFGITSYYFLLLFSPNLSSLPSAEELVKDLIFTKGVSAQNDPIVVNYLINHHLISPNFGTDYNLTNILNPQQLDINVQSALRHVFGGRVSTYENNLFRNIQAIFEDLGNTSIPVLCTYVHLHIWLITVKFE